MLFIKIDVENIHDDMYKNFRKQFADFAMGDEQIKSIKETRMEKTDVQMKNMEEEMNAQK